MSSKNKRSLAFSIDFEGFVEGMEQSFFIPDQISRYEIENELQSNLNLCLEFLDTHKIQSTFFILGWIGKKFPKMVAYISDQGHEIASHSLYHKRLSDLSNSEIQQNLSESKKILEDASGKEVLGFRAPDFSLPHNNRIIDYLLNIGYKYDSSLIYTNVHDVYKGPKVESNIFYFDNGLIEFPISNISFYNFLSVPVGGGGYLRLYPKWVTKYFLKTSKAPILYLHPYELGGNYPRKLKMSAYRKFRHTFNINNVLEKTVKIIQDFNSVSVKTFLKNRGYFV